MTAIALTIAGSDSGGGAGIQADLKTFAALGVYGTSVLTALTAQNTQGVTAIHDVPPEFVTAQLDTVLADISVNAIKIGMLGRPDVIRAVADGLDKWNARIVVLDPVMVATSGGSLLQDDAVSVLVKRLFHRSTIVTPNLPESARLTGQPIARNRHDMETQGVQLLALGAPAVLLKGGHGTDDESADLLLTKSGSRWFVARRHPTSNTHGTGCTLSAAIAAGLAKGQGLEDAIESGKAFVTEAIKASDRLIIGNGHGPLHHFYRIWD